MKYKIGKKEFDFNFAHVMAILNITPDSFSDGGKFLDKDIAVLQALKMIEEGADIIDIGGESTRPGSEQVDEEVEIRRVIPVIKEVLSEKPDAVISVDTTKANVAREALANGALIVNDISGGTFNPKVLNVVKENDAAIVLMHIKGKPKTMQESPEYFDVVKEVIDFLFTQSQVAEQKGIKKIFIDPGIGFGKKLEHNLKLLDKLEEFKSIGYPILIGLSRKSLIGNILDLPVDKRDDASNALNAFAFAKGARIIRTHNVKQAVETCKLFNRIISN
jgi:dihydropteroate synthase